MKPTPRQLIAELPNTIRVGAYTFGIEIWNRHESLGAQRYGECSSTEQMIRVQDDFATVCKAVDTVLHEITHAIWWASGIQDDDKEERTVNALGSGWLQVYRDNSWLLPWLQKALA